MKKKHNFEPGTFVFGAVYGVAPGVGEPEAGAAIRRSGPEGFLDPGMGARHARALQFWGCPAIRLKGEDIFYERSAKNDGLPIILYRGRVKRLADGPDDSSAAARFTCV